MDPQPVGLSPRSTTRGRPRLTSGSHTCARCGRKTTRRQATWPEGQICFTCWFDAIHVTDLSQLTRPDSGAGHDVPCGREDDDLPDESI
jgi:hypothetical protein